MPPAPHVPAAEAEAHAALVAALDAGDLAGADLERARSLVGSCAGCAALQADLAALRGALVTLPVPPRRRDYRLTEVDAARLRPSGWRRFVGWLAAPGSSVRPLATGLATLGIAGLLLSAGLPGLGAGGAATLSTAGERVEAPAAGGADGQSGDGATHGPAAAPAAVPLVATAAPAPFAATAPAPAASAPAAGAALPDAATAPAPAASAAPADAGAAGLAGAASPAPSAERNVSAAAPDEAAAGSKSAADSAAAGGGLPLPLLASAVLLVAGLGLFAARTLALRRT